MVAPSRSRTAEQWWDEISRPGFLEGLLKSAPRDFCALECLANNPRYAKPDSQKYFFLWEARKSEIDAEYWINQHEKHSALVKLFIRPEGADTILRFPFNPWDTELLHKSLSWKMFVGAEQAPYLGPLYLLPRWSTASRSCLTAIPNDVDEVGAIPMPPADSDYFMKRPKITRMPKGQNREFDIYINVPEWDSYNFERFYISVSNVGSAAKGNTRFRLYSIKTGVSFVGSTNEALAGKDLLEANCQMAMARSEVIAANPGKDDTFDVQVEVLTVTAPIERYSDNAQRLRDGFQVRDLSCMQRGLDYIPGQAIPYARKGFDSVNSPVELSPDEQRAFWHTNFAVPLGRAKARLFLNYGLIHTSANAQNFILGFLGPTLKQFVVRDIGDSSWHDVYLEKYFNPPLTDVYRAWFRESKEANFHLLKRTSSHDYPPPHIVRLSANSVLTHGFAAALKEKQSWMDKHVYSFATGILDGFKDFMMEALSLKPFDPWRSPLDPTVIRRYGIDGKYPCGKQPRAKDAYEQLCGEVVCLAPEALLGQAVQVRERGQRAIEIESDRKFYQSIGEDDWICTLINAEELLLCAAFNRLLEKEDRFSSLLDLLKGKSEWPRVIK